MENDLSISISKDKTLSSAVKYIVLKLLCMNHSFFVWFTCIAVMSRKTEDGDRKAEGIPILLAGPLKSSQFIRKTLESPLLSS